MYQKMERGTGKGKDSRTISYQVYRREPCMIIQTTTGTTAFSFPDANFELSCMISYKLSEDRRTHNLSSTGSTAAEYMYILMCSNRLSTRMATHSCVLRLAWCSCHITAVGFQVCFTSLANYILRSATNNSGQSCTCVGLLCRCEVRCCKL